MLYDQVYQEYLDALNGLQVAAFQFDNADHEHVDIAVHQLQAAELKVNVALRMVKTGGYRMCSSQLKLSR